jgi:hypothetical protein
MKETIHLLPLVPTACLSFLLWGVGDLDCAGRPGGTGNADDACLFVLGWTNSGPEDLLRVGVLGKDTCEERLIFCTGEQPTSWHWFLPPGYPLCSVMLRPCFGPVEWEELAMLLPVSLCLAKQTAVLKVCCESVCLEKILVSKDIFLHTRE